MTTPNDDALRRYMEGLKDAQDEIYEAMAARKGVKGEEYSTIVNIAACSIAVTKYLIIEQELEENTLIAECTNHTIACIVTHAMQQVCTLFGQENFHSSADPLLVEFTSDLNALIGKMIGRFQ